MLCRSSATSMAEKVQVTENAESGNVKGACNKGCSEISFSSQHSWDLHTANLCTFWKFVRRSQAIPINGHNVVF